MSHEQQVDSLAELLSYSQSGSHQQQLFKQLEALQKNFNAYPYFLAVAGSSKYSAITRQTSIITLKNIVKRHFVQLAPQLINILRHETLRLFSQSLADPQLAKILGLFLSVLMQESQVDYETLNLLLDGTTRGSLISLQCLSRIIEDFRVHNDQNKKNIFEDNDFAAFLENLLKVLLDIVNSNYTELKVEAMHCFNLLIYPMPILLLPYLNKYVSVLCNSICNPVTCLRSLQGLEALAETRKDLITPEILNLVASADFKEEKEKKCEANFWLQVIDSQGCECLKPHIQRLFSKFISTLVFTEEDMKNMIANNNQNLQRFADDDNEGETESEEKEKSEKDFFQDNGGDYTMRKRSAHVISKLALNFEQDAWSSEIKTIVAQLLQENNWLLAETGVLYIGTVAEFSKEYIKNDLVQFLDVASKLMNNFAEKPHLKATTLWAFAQFSEEIIHISETVEAQLLNNYLMLVISNLSSEAQNVKKASCTALGKLIQAAAQKIAPVALLILEALCKMMPVYKGDALFCLYDTLATLSEAIPQSLRSAQLAQVILVPLCQKWSQLKESDKNLNPLLECMTCFASDFSTFVAPYAVEIYSKILILFDIKYKQQLLRAIDLAEALLDSKCPELGAVVIQSGLVSKLLEFIMGKDDEIRQFSYCLLKKVACEVGLSHPKETLDILIKTIDSNKPTIANNGLFCSLQIMNKFQIGEEYVIPLFELAFKLLKSTPKNNKTLQVNFAKLVGKIVNFAPELFAPKNQIFIIYCFCAIKSKFKDDNMNDAFRGLLRCIKLNPKVVYGHFEYIVDSFMFFQEPAADVVLMFVELLKQFRASAGQKEWQGFLNKKIFLPGAVKKIQNYFA